MNKYLKKVAETVQLEPHEVNALLSHKDTPSRAAITTGGVLPAVFGGAAGGIIGGVLGAAVGSIPVLRPFHKQITLGGAAIGAGGLGYLSGRRDLEAEEATYKSQMEDHAAWNNIREAVGLDTTMGTVQTPHRRPLTLNERVLLGEYASYKNPHEEAIEAATYTEHETGNKIFDRQEYYRVFKETEDYNKRMRAFKQKLGIEKVASLTRILGSKGFTGALKGNMARQAGRVSSGEISSRPLFPSMGKVGPGGHRKFNKPMSDAQFRFAKPQLVERARLLENMGKHPKLGLKKSTSFRKNTMGIEDLISKADSPKALLRSAQIQEASNKAIFRAKQAPTGTVKIPTLNQKVPNGTPSPSF